MELDQCPVNFTNNYMDSLGCCNSYDVYKPNDLMYTISYDAYKPSKEGNCNYVFRLSFHFFCLPNLYYIF